MTNTCEHILEAAVEGAGTFGSTRVLLLGNELLGLLLI